MTVTMCTVGYGDVTPKTMAGYIITLTTMILSALYMAIPIGIVGSAFDNVWRDRGRLLLMKRTRDRLVQLGYSAKDIPYLFQLVGRKADDKGHLHFSEFRRLITQMRVSMSAARVYELFHNFDTDNSGTIDDKEFMQGLFPATYAEHYERSLGLPSTQN